ncbi:uncharacterized protein LOC135331369 [Halichondria panicea]|uniref:uncharacterized protein LOC135331369 n=1 Tax=Halichondria panicea TaxID=6063 RepID=UPI00312B466F
MSTEDPLELVPCPFDPVHMVQRKRMQYHIMKCSKNMDMRKFRTCPFNAQHIVVVEEYEHHVKTCEGRAVVEKEIIYRQNASNPEVVMATGHLYVPPSNFVVPETTECWDDDDCTVMVGSSSFGPPRQPTPSKTQQRPRESSTRLPRRVGMGENERTAVFDYSARTKPVGRGRGRGRGLAAVSYSRGLQLPPALETSASELDTQTETATESEATPEEKRMRDIRKLKKMLRQIEKIEAKKSEGRVLNADQEDKLSKKPNVLDGLSLLENGPH